MLPETLPALEVIRLQLRGFEREARRADQHGRLEHERHRVADLVRLRRVAHRCLFERVGIRPMARHAVVQARAARHEAFRLGVIFTVDQPHELVHKIAMKPRRTKCMLGHHPSRRKDCEVNIRGSRNL